MMNLLLVAGALSMSFILVILSIPAILRIARAKQLYEPFEERKIHKQLVPPFGGVAIFIGFLFTTIITSYQIDFNSLKYVVVATAIMFFVGLKDDLIIISPSKKFLIQVWAALVLIVLGDFRFTSLHGLLGIHEINYAFSVFISLFFIIAVTNAFNLVDGIDGLASGLAVVGLLVLGIWFVLTGNYGLAIVCAALIGSLLAFFLFNVFGVSNKLFMGDSGSLIIGIVISVLIIKFNEINLLQENIYVLRAVPAISLSIIIVPVIDLMRVMTIRIVNRKSPFKPDRNHIHHVLLKQIDSHLHITLILAVVTIVMIGYSIILGYSGLSVNVQFLLVLSTAVLLSQVPSLIVSVRDSKSSKYKSTSLPVFSIHRSHSNKSYIQNAAFQQKNKRVLKKLEEKEENDELLQIEFRS